MIVLSGCNKDKIPGVYRIDIQQGNAIDQDMINQLKSGMSKKQVSYVMGTPLLIDTFHPNRWDYVYSIHPGNGTREQRKLTLYFDETEKLDFIKGDILTVAQEDLPQSKRNDVNVIVPLQEKKSGLFQGLLNAVGLGGDDSTIITEKPVKAVASDEAISDQEVKKAQ